MNTAISWEECEHTVGDNRLVLKEASSYQYTETDDSVRRAFFKHTSPQLAKDEYSFLPGEISDNAITQKMQKVPVPVFEPIKETPQVLFALKRSWEGYVLEIYEDGFLARLVDPQDQHPDEEAEFSFDEINDYDRELIEHGAVFYWSVGYRRSPSGSNERASSIHFRRLPAWSKEELKAAKDYGKRLSQKFNQSE